MSAAARAAEALSAFLQGADGYTRVRHLVRNRAIPRMREGSLGVYLGQCFGTTPEDLAEEMVQEYLRYLLEDFLPNLASRPDQVTAILNGEVDKVLRHILERFLWQLRDKARRKDINPRAYLHRRAREVLGLDREFTLVQEGRDRVSYSMAAPDPPVRDPAAFSGLDYGRWPAPPDPGTRDGIFTAAYLSGAARFFHDQVVRHLGRPMAIPIRELVRYLAAHHAWLDRLQPCQLATDLPLAAETGDPEEQVNRIISLPSIAVIAAQFAMGMDADARKILSWSLEDSPPSYREMAERLGLPDHNHPYRIWKRTEEALREFVANWPGPPLKELPEDVSLMFIEELRRICKNSVS